MSPCDEEAASLNSGLRPHNHDAGLLSRSQGRGSGFRLMPQLAPKAALRLRAGLICFIQVEVMQDPVEDRRKNNADGG